MTYVSLGKTGLKNSKIIMFTHVLASFSFILLIVNDIFLLSRGCVSYDDPKWEV